MKRSTPNSLALIALGFLIPIAASEIASRLAGKGFRAITTRPPPENPAAPGVKWKHALLWTALSGLAGGLAQIVTRKAMARAGFPAKTLRPGAALRSLLGRA